MKTQLLSLLLLLPLLSFAQAPTDTVDIPDPHFKYALLHPQEFHFKNPIIDTNNDGEIEYGEAEAVTYLNLLDATLDSYKPEKKTSQNNSGPEPGIIHDLTGIEAFSNLTYLNVGSASTSGGANQVDSLDLSQNTALDTVMVYSNVLTHLEIGANPNLLYLDCSFNDLTNLDVSQCSSLKFLDCRINPFEKVDIRNGNNENLTFFSVGCDYYYPDCNPNPTCIFVDNVSYFENNFPTDSTYHYVENEEQCAEALSVKKFTPEKLRIYPNPVKTSLHIIGRAPIRSIILYNLQGEKLDVYKKIKQKPIDLSSFPSGVYFLKIKTNHSISIHKIIKL